MGLASKMKKSLPPPQPQPPQRASVPYLPPPQPHPPPRQATGTILIPQQPTAGGQPYARIGVPGQNQYGTLPNRSNTVDYGGGNGGGGGPVTRAATLPPSLPPSGDAPPPPYAGNGGGAYNPFDKSGYPSEPKPSSQYGGGGGAVASTSYALPQQQQQQQYYPPPQQQQQSLPTSQSTPQDYAQQHDILSRHLGRIVQENGLQGFYPPQRLDQVVKRVARVDFSALSTFWTIPKEIA
ncbi:hypothetical protein HDU67_008251, partial [Dinochytrium kinnereticum]